AGPPECTDLLALAAQHGSPLVRYWAQIGLGSTHSRIGVQSMIAGLGDRTKLVRNAASWALRQALLDDKGWNETLTAARTGDDYSREQAWQALNMRADAVMPRSIVK